MGNQEDLVSAMSEIDITHNEELVGKLPGFIEMKKIDGYAIPIDSIPVMWGNLVIGHATYDAEARGWRVHTGGICDGAFFSDEQLLKMANS